MFFVGIESKKYPMNGVSGGEGGIRTLGRVAPTLDFESSTFDHSATSPESVSSVDGHILSGALRGQCGQGLNRCGL